MPKQAIFWFMLSLIISCSNDLLTKFLVTSVEVSHVIFWRFFWGAITLLPLIFYQGFHLLKSNFIGLHLVRGGILAIAIFLWNCGIQIAPITTVTVMSFTVPIFTLALAPILLKEKVTWQLWLVTLAGFLGVITVFLPSLSNFNYTAIIFIIAASLFAFLDIINKKLLSRNERTITMLIYSAFFSLFFSSYPVLTSWKTPSFLDMVIFAFLGIGSNFILYSILKAFQYTSASSLAPLRYLELLFSIIAGYLFFHEIPSYNTYIGAAIIIVSSFIITQFRASNSYVKK